MAEEGEDWCVVAQLKVLTGLQLPNFNWKANNMRMEFEIFEQTLKFMLNGIFEQTLKFMLNGMEIPRGQVVPLHSSAAWQRGDGVMECKYQRHSTCGQSGTDLQGLQEGL